MPENTLSHLLTRFGLSDKEGSLYLAALSLGESGMSELSARARLNRSTAYLIFASLEAKGLMATFRNRRGARFVATRPSAVVSQARERVDQLEGALPELNALLPKETRAPKVSYYEGTEGYFVATQASLETAGGMIRHIGSLSEIHRVVTADYDAVYYVPQRVRRRLPIRCLYFARDMTDPRIRAYAPDELREVRFLPDSAYFETSSLIYGNTVAYFSDAQDLATVIMESEKLTRAEEKKFDLLWGVAERVRPA